MFFGTYPLWRQFSDLDLGWFPGGILRSKPASKEKPTIPCMVDLSNALNVLCTIGTLTICLVAGTCFGQSKQSHTSLCSLQGKVAEGDQISVKVSGVYEGGLGESGLAMGLLEDSSCPDQNAWVEIVLQSKVNRKKLISLLDRSDRAYVVFEGDLYGPPLPDPKLPDAIRKVYHPGWGHLGAFRTKLIVHVIRYAAAVPSARPQQ
jgi:hypothetical protein